MREEFANDQPGTRFDVVKLVAEIVGNALGDHSEVGLALVVRSRGQLSFSMERGVRCSRWRRINLCGGRPHHRGGGGEKDG